MLARLKSSGHTETSPSHYSRPHLRARLVYIATSITIPYRTFYCESHTSSYPDRGETRENGKTKEKQQQQHHARDARRHDNDLFATLGQCLLLTLRFGRLSPLHYHNNLSSQ